MKIETYTFTYIDEFGDTNTANCRPNEYHSLMELLFDKYLQEWGDCKGRAWCGTCHIQIMEGHSNTKILEDEGHTLSKLSGSNACSRLACQIPVNAELHQMAFRIISDNDYGSK
ncbi:2Fe-2S iron-sulfur cluster-binding protein [Arenibacter sp. F20364]|uniref:2Fe-2S iron-sulfur cluster-binding protein n=1 Tax=Arenibacter sp. F20364 TaxID=2926415 RepID=UPI001FF2326C|nr:2Fe-2S iron-sulfur cluster-binding protein [Arenibacter sp. F20364]MCK0189823.1 2Fe-2S iron-sulfur cluster-binding protein [Arenibacter sp. F20364]